MKYLFFLLFMTIYTGSFSQTIDEAYVKQLYAKYPTEKSNLCAACKYWKNPLYQSIADTQMHMPIVTYYVYTKEHRLLQESAKIPRTGIFAAWSPVYGQPKLDNVYKAANKQIGKPGTINEAVYGHCQAWILLAWCNDGAILSDTQDFNEGVEYQGQNIGTEIATEDLCRTLTGWKTDAVTDSVKIWCGTYGSQGTYTDGKIVVNVPSHYWKVIKYFDQNKKEEVTLSYWMPNQVTEDQAMLPQRVVTFEQLVTNLKFDPTETLK